MAISDLVQLQLGWLNAWIPSFALVLIQFLYMLLYKEGGKRAVDTSWHTAKDKRYATLSYIIQLVVLLISLFVPLQIGTPLFMAGSLLFACRATRCTSSMKWEHWRYVLLRLRCCCYLPLSF